MTDDRAPHLTDRSLRAALTQDPPGGTADAFWHRLTVALGETPQRRRRLVAWPWTSPLPAVQPSLAQRRLSRLAVMGVVALLAATTIAVVGLIASQPRLPAPFGLARAGLIAFDSGGDIFVSNADGTDRRQLTSGATSDLQPTYSPDGTRIAYQSLGAGGTTVEMVVMDANGANRTTIATKPATIHVGSETSIAWWRLSWSPDSRSIAYNGFVEGRPQIFVARADGTRTTLIGDQTLEGQDPAWSPDGERIAFRGGRSDEERGIFLMNADGSGVRPLIEPNDDPMGNTYSYFGLVWSPDGTRIAYPRWAEGYASQIWLVGVDDGVERAISTATAWNDFPVWSPDGSHLAYFTRPTWNLSHGRFVVVRPDGSGEIVLTPAVTGEPAWSPDGSKLVGIAVEGDSLRQDSVTMIDIAQDTSVVLPPREATDASGKVVQGIPSWQRLAD